ncbi:MAG: hypothetical protein WCK63_10735 [Betaproteobacteria bacterium]
MIKKSIKLITIISTILLVCGCATSQRMSDDDRAKIKSVIINESVEKGQVFLLAPGGASVGLMFGAVGGAVSAGLMVDAQTAFTDYLSQNSISIEKIIREEVENAVQGSGKLTIASSSESTIPTIKISVLQYGFGVTHLLSSNVVPVLYIKCEMVDSSGKVVWSESDRMLPSIASPMDAIAWAQLTNDPKKIEDQLRKASKYLADRIVKEL